MSSDSAAPISSGIVLPYPPSSTFLIYRTYLGGDITDALLEQCAQLFGNNYGVWGSNPTTTKGPKAGVLLHPYVGSLDNLNNNPGSRVKMSARRLREQCVAVPNSTILVVCYGSKKTGQGLDDVELVGHAFASVWDFNGGNCHFILSITTIVNIYYLCRVGWITQLVVSLAKRKRYIATSLLQMLKKSTLFHGITAIGLVSSHPSACHVLFKYAGMELLPYRM